jgi:hypothetical protein
MHALELLENLWAAPQKGITILVPTKMKCTNLVHFLEPGLPFVFGNSFIIELN